MFEDPLKPINQDAANLLRPVACPPIKATWTPQYEEDIRWQGLISSSAPSAGTGPASMATALAAGSPWRKGEG